jgi:hypothetical protein
MRPNTKKAGTTACLNVKSKGEFCCIKFIKSKNMP